MNDRVRVAFAMTYPVLLFGVTCILGTLLPAPASAQATRVPVAGKVESTGVGIALRITVYSETKQVRLDRQALVKLTNRSTQFVTWQTTSDRAEATLADLPRGSYGVEVSATGYLTGHKELDVMSTMPSFEMDIVLQRDPAALDFNVAEGAMPRNARKEAKRGIYALKSGNLKEANKRLDKAYKLAPSNPDLNFLLGFLFYQKRDFGQAQTFLGTATNLNPNNAQALTLLGRLGLQQEDYGRARSTLEKAVAADPGYWIAHDLLADAYLHQMQFEKARDEAQLAIEKGKGGSGSSRLVLGEALVNLGKRQEGIEKLKDFLRTSPKSQAVPQVRDLVARLEAQESRTATNGTETEARLIAVDPLIAAAEPTFSILPWQPPGIDDTKLSVAAGVSCPFENVIDASGKRAKELVDDVARIAAIEHLLHEQLDEMGNPITRATRDFDYVASISEVKPGVLDVNEYRAERLGVTDFPDQIASSGFAALALVFHPAMRDNFEMNCEGLGAWHGQATWLVHFKERGDRPSRMHAYQVGEQSYPLQLKGRAWITADKFQIVRIESELVSPVPKIRLVSEHQIVEYGPVPFQKQNTELWLPQSAEIYFDFRRHRYYRRHSFDHYMLFAVSSSEKRKEPKASTTQPNP